MLHNKINGSNFERNVINYLYDKGFEAIRVVGSGGGTIKDRPDILAGNMIDIYAIEVKTSLKEVIYIKKQQIKELINFSIGFGATPLVCVNFMKNKDIFFLKVCNLDKTRDMYKISYNKALKLQKENKAVAL